MYVGNSAQGIREAWLQPLLCVWYVLWQQRCSWGTSELCPCMEALQPTARLLHTSMQLWPCTLQSECQCLFAFQNFPSDQEDPEARVCQLHGDTLRAPAGSNAGVPEIFGEHFSKAHLLLSHCTWWICKTHQVEMMMFSGLMGIIQGSWATYPLAELQQAPVCSFTWSVTDTSVKMSWVIFWTSKKESCVGYPAADPGALHFWLAQDIQKNLSISRVLQLQVQNQLH